MQNKLTHTDYIVNEKHDHVLLKSNVLITISLTNATRFIFSNTWLMAVKQNTTVMQ